MQPSVTQVEQGGNPLFSDLRKGLGLGLIVVGIVVLAVTAYHFYLLAFNPYELPFVQSLISAKSGEPLMTFGSDDKIAFGPDGWMLISIFLYISLLSVAARIIIGFITAGVDLLTPYNKVLKKLAEQTRLSQHDDI